MTTAIPPLEERLGWFKEDRFGMFVHWGMYAVLGRGEQILSRDLIPKSEYEPVAERFQPAADWADKLAQDAVKAGARYVVLTTRHHDGYCLFDTRTDPFNAAETGPGRDLIAEYVKALRKAGLKVGFYYSLMNWRWPGFWDAEGHPDDLPAMVEEVHTQVRELMSNYGQVDILWYDGQAVPGQRTPGQWGGRAIEQTPAEFWRADELNAMVRELQPRILINNRAGDGGDFGTPEQKVSTQGEGRSWETCMTINPAPSWGYLSYCSVNKSAAEVLYHLLDAVRLGGNFLFNVGPNAQGYVDRREAEVLDRLGAWFDRHGEAVYGTAPEGIYNLSAGHVQGAMFHYGMWTCKDTTGYLSLFRYPGSELVVSKIAPAPKAAMLLTTGEALELKPLTNSRTLISGLPDAPPDPLAPVIKVDFDTPPQAVETLGAAWLNGDFA
jgi:alpha-L-fucosidase